MRESLYSELAKRLYPSDIYTMENLEMVGDFLLVGGMTLIALITFILLKTLRDFSRRLLAVFFGAGFFFLLYYYGFIHRSRTVGGIALFFGYGMGFLLGPVLLAYVQSLFLPASAIINRLIKNLIPYFVYWIGISLPLAISVFTGSVFSGYGQWIADYADYFNLVENVFFLVFIAISLRLLNKAKVVFESYYSNLDEKDLNWCKHLISGIALIVLFDSILSVYELLYPPQNVIFNIGTTVAFALTFLYAYLGYRGMFHSKVLLPQFLLENMLSTEQKQVVEMKEAVSYHLKNADVEEMALDLKDIMINKKPYLNEELTLSDLAQELEITDKKLSELLNLHMKTNFYDFVNTYRIEAVKERLADTSYDNLTLLAIGFDCGFKSKTSFNRVFRQHTDMSPSQYKRNLKLSPKLKKSA